MATQDVTIFDDTNTKSVSIVTDSTTERLAVDAKITSISTYLDNEVTYSIEQGKAYISTGSYATLAANSTMTIMITTPATNYIHMRDMTVNITKSGASVATLARFWGSSTTSTAGTSNPIYNLNRVTTNTSNVLIGIDPTITSTGTKLMEVVTHTDWETYLAPSYTSPFKWILKQNTKYLLQLVNPSNQAITFTWFLFWLEEEH